MSKLFSSRVIKLFSITFVLLIVLLRIGIYTNFSGVNTEKVWLTTSEGVRLSARVYKPTSASEIMPGIVVCHGLMASHQTMQSSFSLEFAKRGFLVVALDLSGHGDSEGSLDISFYDVGSSEDLAGNNYVDFPKDGLTAGKSEATLEFWLNPDEWVSTHTLWDEWSDPYYWQFTIREGEWYTRDNSTGDAGSRGNDLTLPTLTTGEWHHLVFVYSVSQSLKAIYLDGELNASTNVSVGPLTITRTGARIGYSSDGTFFDGKIDDVRISNVSRSPAWIKTSYESGRDNLINFGTEEIEADGGWLDGWGKRVELTIDHNNLDSPLSSFPVLIRLSNSSGPYNDDVSFIFDEFGSDNDRKKIAVTNSDGLTQGYVEIDTWNHTTKEAWLWVKVPNLSSSEDTNLYLYYDSSQDSNTDYVGDSDSIPTENVWIDNFKLVTHMNDDPDTSHIRDSTSNNNDGTKNDAGSDEVYGNVGKAQNFESLWELKAEVNVRAGLDYLLSRTDVDHGRIAVLGHSLGGAMVFTESYSDPRVKSVVAIAPALSQQSRMNSTSPKNLLLAVGGRDNIVRETLVLGLLGRTTNGGEEIGKLYGNFSEGNARKMIVSPGTDHAAEMLDPYIAQASIKWVEASLGINLNISVSISPWLYITLGLSGAASFLSVFPIIACAKRLGRWIRKGELSQKPKLSRVGVWKLVILYFVAWGYGAFSTFILSVLGIGRGPLSQNIFGVPFGSIGLYSWIPVLFADLFVNAFVVASVILLLCIIVLSRTKEKPNLGILEFKTSAVLGTTGFLIMFSAINVSFTSTFMDLFPTIREVFLMIKMFILLLPLTIIDELWLRNLQNRMTQPWQKIGIPVLLYLLPKVFPLAFASFIFGNFVFLASIILFIPALFTAWLFNESGSVTGGAIFNALLYSWFIAVILPFRLL